MDALQDGDRGLRQSGQGCRSRLLLDGSGDESVTRSITLSITVPVLTIYVTGESCR